MKKILEVLSLCLCIGACGFQPLYQQHQEQGNWLFNDKQKDTSIIDEMAQIKVMPIAERFGQQLKNSLLDLISPKGVPAKSKYRLEVKLKSKTITQQAMRDDVTATNERIEYKVVYTLWQSNEKLLTSETMAFVGYDILTNPYSTTMASKKAESDAAQIIANDIALRLAAYFHDKMSVKYEF